jgi:hypothetical protein
MRRRALIAALAAMAILPPMTGRAEEGSGPKTRQSYLRMQTVAVSIIHSNGGRGVLTVEVGVDVPDPSLRNRIELFLPRLTSAYVSALQPYAIGLGPAQPPNADYISMTLQRETDRVLGRRGAHLLLGTILLN